MPKGEQSESILAGEAAEDYRAGNLAAVAGMETGCVKKPQFTHLGNAELRTHHAVMVEGGNVPRARVMDQHIFDRYLMRGLLTLNQHRAAEFLLLQASRAGVWAKGVNWSGAGGGGRTNHVPFGAFPFGQTLSKVEKRYGRKHAFVVRRVVCYDWDVSNNERLMKCLLESLDLISNCKLGRIRNPLRKLKKAAK